MGGGGGTGPLGGGTAAGGVAVWAGMGRGIGGIGRIGLFRPLMTVAADQGEMPLPPLGPQ
ncbi:hypothetical protein GCM10023321_64070 [Pseudonocardia eucalypti]|uniref:Uncharacterized protein n=1 Tax=Pseudonocardia eucalypti TaxID=648755 RepID=A0ABP9QX89_9PSEU